MIASVFNKSKPINFIIVLFIVLLAFIMARTELINKPINVPFVLGEIGVLIICGISVLLINFIVRKNNLTKSNNYNILLFSLFLLLISQTTGNSNIIFSNLFILLGLRRIISLHSQKNIKIKLFDTAIFVAIATLFYFWAILFFALIIFTLILYTDNNIRHWIIPFLGITTIFMVSVAISIIFYGDYLGFFDVVYTSNYNFNNYNSIQFLVATTLLLSFGIWSSIFYLKNNSKKNKIFKTSFKIIILAAIIGFLIVLQSPEKNGSEFLFLFAPLAIIITNYIEIIQEKWFKEIFLWVLLITPFVLLLI